VRAIVALAVPLILVGACSSDDKATSTPAGSSLYSGEIKQGIATSYDATGEGNCLFDATPGDLDVAAIDTADYAKSAACGACVHIKGPNGEVTVRIVDSCPGCDGNHLDLSKSSFAKLAPVEKGRIDITFQTVACSVTGNLAFHFKDGSSKYWTAIQVRNHRLPIAKLEYQKDGAFVEIARQDYNYFVVESGVGDLPNGLLLRVTSVDGQVLEDKLPGDIPNNQTVDGTNQFN